MKGMQNCVVSEDENIMAGSWNRRYGGLTYLGGDGHISAVADLLNVKSFDDDKPFTDRKNTRVISVIRRSNSYWSASHPHWQ
jgi:hypothetical protein